MAERSFTARWSSTHRRRGIALWAHRAPAVRRALLATLLCAMGASGSGAASEAGMGAAGLQDVETIVVLPIVLSRGIEVDDRAELQRNIDKMLLRKLALKGYVLDRPRGWSLPEDWTVEALKPLAPSALVALLPPRAPHVALLFVERIVESPGTVASSANVEIAARIIAAQTGEVLWHAQSGGRYSENLTFPLTMGLIPQLVIMAFSPDKYLALERAFGQLFEAFPERP